VKRSIDGRGPGCLPLTEHMAVMTAADRAELGYRPDSCKIIL
jgi:hypothetical protein